MSSKARRLIAALLTLVVCITSVPVAALASQVYPAVIDRALDREGFSDKVTYVGRDSLGNYIFRQEYGSQVVFTPGWVEAVEGHCDADLCEDADGEMILRDGCPCPLPVKTVIRIAELVYFGFCLCRDIRSFLISKGWWGHGHSEEPTYLWPYYWINADIYGYDVYYR
ncbi:MAG: hypothetical protein Q8P22_11680 [Chloroflexota bacterium]|nr:hypothetical protein [Chloroflexota bacterium]